MSDVRIGGSLHRIRAQDEILEESAPSQQKVSSHAGETPCVDHDKALNSGPSDHLLKQKQEMEANLHETPLTNVGTGTTQSASEWMLREGKLSLNEEGGGFSALRTLEHRLEQLAPGSSGSSIQRAMPTNKGETPIATGLPAIKPLGGIPIMGKFDEVLGKFSLGPDLTKSPTPPPPDPTPPVPQDNVPVPTPAELAKQSAADAGDYVRPADAPTNAAASDPTSDVPGGGGDASFDLGGTSPDKQP
jgi:hypothetical protein